MRGVTKAIVLLPVLMVFTVHGMYRSSAARCARVQSAFSPHIEPLLIKIIAEEVSKIRMTAYTFTYPAVSQELIKARKRKVKVEVVIDPYSFTCVKHNKALHELFKAGVAVYQYASEDPYGSIMHHKFVAFENNRFIFSSGQSALKEPEGSDRLVAQGPVCKQGSSLIWTGSANFTEKAFKHNSDHGLIIEDQQTYERFLAEYNRVRKMSCRLIKMQK